MSSVTITPSDIPTFLRDNNTIELSSDTLYTSPNGGGMKILSFGGNRLNIIIPGTVYKMKYEPKENIGMEISKDDHKYLQQLSDAIHSATGVSTRDISYEAEEPYSGVWTRGKLVGYKTDLDTNTIFTKVYKKLETGENEYEEILFENSPNSFRGYGCLEIRGMFFKSLKSNEDVYLKSEFPEFVVEESDVGGGRGSRILKLLGGSIVNTSNKTKPVKEEEEEFHW